MDLKKPKKRRHQIATPKQIRALQLINQGYSKRQAMLKAGYSVNTANTRSGIFMKSEGVRHMIANVGRQLEDEGLTAVFIAEKVKEWFNATKEGKKGKDIPDYETQQRAFDKWYKLIGGDQQGHDSKVKQRITFEKFVSDEEDGK